jgi:ribosomal protein L39E
MQCPQEQERNNSQQNATRDIEKHLSLKHGQELVCTLKVRSSCYTSDSHHFCHVNNVQLSLVVSKSKVRISHTNKDCHWRHQKLLTSPCFNERCFSISRVAFCWLLFRSCSCGHCIVCPSTFNLFLLWKTKSKALNDEIVSQSYPEENIYFEYRVEDFLHIDLYHFIIFTLLDTRISNKSLVVSKSKVRISHTNKDCHWRHQKLLTNKNIHIV